MSGAITAIATTVSAIAANAAAVAGASSAVIEGVSGLAYSAASVGITVGISAGIGALFAPKIPGPQSLQFPLKQPMPIRQSAFGRVRVGGAYMLYTVGGTHPNISYDVLALLDGQSEGIRGYYLHDDLMAQVGAYWSAPGASGKYGGGGSNPPNLVKIESRLGLDTETAYAISSDVAAWTSTHRGDGITSMLLTCIQAKREDQSGDFPNGLPSPSAVIDAQRVYDPRDGGQTQADKSTYAFSDNPVLCLLAYLTDANGGMGLDYTRFILPAISHWTAAADECDGIVATSGMHATLLDAAAPGDTKVYLADTTGLIVGATVQLATETVTVSGFGTGGEVDIIGTLAYGHQAGELAYWTAAGQRSAYRCAGTYTHDTAPGDVVKSILSTFDGWIGQRGDGALVVRTNTLYTPTVTLTDAQIIGYQAQHYLPDEQATNQLVVSYTDPAAAFNKAEAGYVQNAADIASRGQLRSQTLDLPWVPSAPQAIDIATAVLRRSTQALRGTVTCRIMPGLNVMGQRYVQLQIPELAELSDLTVEVTGKVAIDLAGMTASFPWVATSGGTGRLARAAICIAIDASVFTSDGVTLKGAATAMLEMLRYSLSPGPVDLCVVAFGEAALTTDSITRRSATSADVDDLQTWIAALSISARDCLPQDGMAAAKTFFDATDAGLTNHILVWLTDSYYRLTPADTQAAATAAGAVLATISPAPQAFTIGTTDLGTPPNPDYLAPTDNTPVDGVPILTGANISEVTAAIEQAIFGSTTSAGSSYTVPPQAPPSGAPSQPLTAPTIVSVTPEYPPSGAGVAGATLAIVVDDPGGNVTWRVRWMVAGGSAWASAGDQLDGVAAGMGQLAITTGLVVATGSIDVQVEYETASQVSPWSATTTVSVSAPGASNVDVLFNQAGQAMINEALQVMKA